MSAFTTPMSLIAKYGCAIGISFLICLLNFSWNIAWLWMFFFTTIFAVGLFTFLDDAAIWLSQKLKNWRGKAN